MLEYKKQKFDNFGEKKQSITNKQMSNFVLIWTKIWAKNTVKKYFFNENDLNYQNTQKHIRALKRHLI